MTLCPCGSGSDFITCCEPILSRQRSADTAERLMRARYSAYVSHNIDFIMNSTLPASRSNSDIEAMRTWAESADWQGLEILSISAGGVDDNQGEVEFIARYKLQDAPHHHHEKSLFAKVDGQWFFKDGTTLFSGPSSKPVPVVNSNKAGRNDPCPCGSGKKFKKCCGS